MPRPKGFKISNETRAKITYFQRARRHKENLVKVRKDIEYSYNPPKEQKPKKSLWDKIVDFLTS